MKWRYLQHDDPIPLGMEWECKYIGQWEKCEPPTSQNRMVIDSGVCTYRYRSKPIPMQKLELMLNNTKDNPPQGDKQIVVIMENRDWIGLLHTSVVRGNPDHYPQWAEWPITE